MEQTFDEYLRNKEQNEVKDLISGEDIPVDADLSDENDGEIIVVKEETKTEEQPKLGTSDTGSFHGIFLSPINHFERIKAFLIEEATRNEELAKAIQEGKKTFEGCDRFIKNNMKDLMREMKAQEVTFDDATIHRIAVWYMTNPDAVDVQNAVKASKPKAEKKPKAEPKPKKENKKVIPLTPQMGSLFGDDDF